MREPANMNKNQKAKELEDEQFEAFMKESISSSESSMDAGSLSRHLNMRSKPSKFNTIDDDEDDSDGARLVGNGKSFLKKSSGEMNSGPVPSLRKVLQKPPLAPITNGDLDRSLDSTSQDGVGTFDRGRSLTLQHGKETLEELADKERFFKKLEADVNRTPDYGRLNKDLDQSETMNVTTADDMGDSDFDINRMSLDRDSDASPIRRHELNKPNNMLSQVALIDSMDSTTERRPASGPWSPDEKRPTSGGPWSPDTGGDHLTTSKTNQIDYRNSFVDDNRRANGQELLERETAMRATGRDDDGSELRDADISHTTTTRGGVMTNKTSTGMGYTDTGRDLEAMRKEMWKYGGGNGSFDSSKDFTMGLLPEDSSIGGGLESRKDSLIGMEGEVAMANRKGSLLVGVQTDQLETENNSAELNRLFKQSSAASKPGVISRKPIRRGEGDTPKNQRSSDQPSVHFNEQAQEYSKSDSFSITDDISNLNSLDSQKSGTAAAADTRPSTSLQKSNIKRRASKPVIANGLGSSAGKDSLTTKRPTNLPTGQPTKTTLDGRKVKDKFADVKGSGYNQQRRSSSTNTVTAAKSVYSPDDRQRRTDTARQSSGGGRGMGAGRERGGTGDRGGGDVDRNLTVQSLSVSSPFSSDSDEHSRERTAGHRQRSSSVESTSPDGRPPLMQSSTKSPSTTPNKDVKYWQDRFQEEKRENEKLRVVVADLERDFNSRLSQTRSDYEQQLSKLKQENFVLTAKVDEARQRRFTEAKQATDGSADKEQFTQLEAEFREQETLMAGYQTENERIYEEMKKLRITSRATEERMAKENLKLKTDIANLREELSRRQVPISSHNSAVTQDRTAGGPGDVTIGSATLGSARIAQLENELKASREAEEACRNELREMERKIDQLVTRSREQEEELKLAKECQSLESNQLEDRYKKEMEGLRKKLRWYAENQELLDRDAERLRVKDEELKHLRTKVDEIETAAGKKRLEVANNKKERSLDAKRIMDLERQVKEMENILKKRHPNSLPVLMWAASNSPPGEDGGRYLKSPSVEYLEGQIHKLEREIEEKDQEGKRSLRAVEQKYNSMKLKYEERIIELEGLTTRLQRDLHTEPQPHSNILTIQRELESVKDRHRKEMTELEQNNSNLRQEIQTLRSSVRNRLNKNQEMNMANQDDDRQTMIATIDQLERDKQQLLHDLRRMTERLASATLKSAQSPRSSRARDKRGGGVRSGGAGRGVRRSLPAYEDNSPRGGKHYTPDEFGGAHVSDVLAENSLLQQQIASLELKIDEQRVTIHKVHAEAEGRERKLREDAQEQINAFKVAHQQELQRRLAASAYENSSTKVAELSSALATQEVIINHLKSQISQLRSSADEVIALRQSEASLISQLKQCRQDLREAKLAHTPQLRHFEQLLEKISLMEARHQQREQQLEQLLHQSNIGATENITAETIKWQKIVDAKHREIDRFRNELDSILNVLRELQRQGVVIPYRDSASILHMQHGDDVINLD